MKDESDSLFSSFILPPSSFILNVSSDRLVVLNVGFAEVVSILVRRKNTGILSRDAFAQALIHLGREMIHAPILSKVEATNALVIPALTHIENHSINATDAIVLHAALALAQHVRSRGDMVLVASDQRLLRAAQAEGLGTFNPETQVWKGGRMKDESDSLFSSFRLHPFSSGTGDLNWTIANSFTLMRKKVKRGQGKTGKLPVLRGLRQQLVHSLQESVSFQFDLIAIKPTP